MSKGSVKFVVGSSKGIRDGSVVMPISAESSDTDSLVVFQKLLERNPDFNSDPELYGGKITSPRNGVYALGFDVLIATSEGKQERDMTVFDRLIKALADGLRANGIHSNSFDVALA